MIVETPGCRRWELKVCVGMTEMLGDALYPRPPMNVIKKGII